MFLSCAQTEEGVHRHFISDGVTYVCAQIIIAVYINRLKVQEEVTSSKNVRWGLCDKIASIYA